jgi:hypothetical protein
MYSLIIILFLHCVSNLGNNKSNTVKKQIHKSTLDSNDVNLNFFYKHSKSKEMRIVTILSINIIKSSHFIFDLIREKMLLIKQLLITKLSSFLKGGVN